MKPYHFVLITIGFAITSEIADSFGYMFIRLISSGEPDYLSIGNQVLSLTQAVIVTAYPLVVLLLAFPSERPNFSWIQSSNSSTHVSIVVVLAILLSITTHPFKEFFLLKTFYTSETFEPYSTLKRGTVIHTLAYFVLILITPIVHELLFRKYLIDRLLASTTITKAFLTQLICYVIFQLITSSSLTEMLVIGITGGVIYIRTRNFYLSLIFSLVFSITTELITAPLSDEYVYNNVFGAMYWIIIGSTTLSIIILTIKGKQLTDAKNP